MDINEILEAEYEPFEVTEKTFEDIKNNPNKYAYAPVRIRMGKFRTPKEYQQYLEDGLNRPLPGGDGPVLKRTIKK